MNAVSEVAHPSTDASIWHFRLYVAGQAPRSLNAFANLTELCEDRLTGRYEIEVIDLLQNPEAARDDDIVAIPTLVRSLPHPTRKVIGDLSDLDRVLVGLQIYSGSAG